MDIQGISSSQILTVSIFLVGLIFLQIFITKNKNKFSSKWRGNKRIQLIEEKALSAAEKIRIISIDGSEFLLISNKGKKSSFVKLNKDPNENKKRSLIVSEKNNNPRLNSETTSAKKFEKTTEHQLSEAIKVARQMNPNLSYK